MSDPSRVRFPWHRSAVRVLTTVVATAESLVVISTVVIGFRQFGLPFIG